MTMLRIYAGLNMMVSGLCAGVRIVINAVLGVCGRLLFRNTLGCALGDLWATSTQLTNLALGTILLHRMNAIN